MFVLVPIYPAAVDGGGSVVYNHYLLSASKVHDVVFVAGVRENAVDYDSSVAFKIVRKAIYRRRTKGYGRMLWLLISVPTFIYWILKYRVDVVHIGAYDPDILGGWMAARVTGRELMTTIHGEELTYTDLRPIWNAKRILWSLYSRAELGALRQCDRIIANSVFTRGVMCDLGVGPDRITVITPGVETGKLVSCEPTGSSIISHLEGKRVVLTVGRFTPRKGQEMVLKALPQLLRRFPEVVYVMAGGGAVSGDQQYLALCRARIEESGLEENALILQDPSDQTIAWLYEACELFVMPNRTMPNGDTEGYGIVFLEAGAWGKPVIGGRAGGAVEAVDHGVTGLLVDGESVEAIADSIATLLADRELARGMGEAGRAKVARNSWAHKAEQYMALVAALAGKRRSRS